MSAVYIHYLAGNEFADREIIGRFRNILGFPYAVKQMQ